LRGTYAKNRPEVRKGEITMANEKSTETMINRSSQLEAKKVMEFLRSLDQDEKKGFLVFLQGVKFAEEINPKHRRSRIK